MADLRIVDAPLLSTVKGTEKIPTGGEGNFSVSVNQVADFSKLKWLLATEGYVDNAVGNVQADLNLHKNNSSNPHGVTKTQVGLGNVDNTADLDKPVSNATQSAIITANSGKADKSYVDSQDQLKADKTTVEASLLLKADKVDLTASKIASDGGQTQQDINDFGGAKWHAKSGGYKLGATVKLTNGDIVKSTVANNIIDPNVDMTGWLPSSTTKNTFVLNPLNSSMRRYLDEKLNGEFASVKDGGAIGDGTLHTLQEWVDDGKFSNLAAIQIVYPSASSLTDSIDTVVIQTWLDTFNRTLIPYGKYFFNKQLVINGFGKEIYSECVSSYGTGDNIRTNFIHGFNGDMISINNDAISPRGRHRIRGLSFISDNNFTGNAITIASSQNHVPDCSFYNFKDGAIKITGKSYGTYLNKCSFDQNGSNGQYDIVVDSLVSATDYNTITTITECIFETPKTGAISLKDSDPFYIGNNYIEPFGSTSTSPMIDIKNSSSGNTKGWVYRNYLGSLNGNGFAIKAIGTSIHVSKNIIADYVNGIYLSSQNGSAVGNDIKGYSSIGIQVASVTSNINNNLNVSGNVLLSKSTGATHGIIASNSTNGNLISSNIVRGKHDYYIRLSSCFNTLVASNSCLPLADVAVSGFGIHEDDNCTGNSVRNNNVQATTKYRRYSFDYDEFVLANNSTPTTGVWLKGNIIKVPDTVAFGAIGYICIIAGTGAAAIWVKYGVIQLTATATYDPPSLTTGSQQSTTITLTGVNLGSFVVCSFSNVLSGTRMWAEVTALNTVTVYHRNDTGSTVDLSSGTLTVKTI